MGKRIFAFALACLAAAALVGPASAAGQCESSCDKAFQQCNGNGTNADSSACLPKWGQCKRACNPPKAVSPAKALTPPPAKVTKVAAAKN